MATNSTADAATTCRKSILSAVAAYLADFCAGAREGKAIEARYNALARKSARELAKLGLTRADIARVAVTGMHRGSTPALN